jgi:hypothetical protein
LTTRPTARLVIKIQTSQRQRCQTGDNDLGVLVNRLFVVVVVVVAAAADLLEFDLFKQSVYRFMLVLHEIFENVLKVKYF